MDFSTNTVPDGTDHFNLDAALQTFGQAALAVLCNVCFVAALHGLVIAVLVAMVGLILRFRQQRFGRPLISVAGKLVLFCGVMILPGICFFISQHQLPATGSFQISSLAFIIFWSWISLHLSAEEMNFEWF